MNELANIQRDNELLRNALDFACLQLQHLWGYKCINGDHCLHNDGDPETCPPEQKAACLAGCMEACAGIDYPDKPKLGCSFDETSEIAQAVIDRGGAVPA